jgi:glycosyltransferase involved in cell wall biosynthesis
VSDPIVSAVMPVRDAAAFVGSAIASIVAQPIDALELIVVDDGSTDGTRDVVERWAAVDRRVRLLDGPALGSPGAAFDCGVEHARGDVVARMDGDDIALPWRLPRQLAFLGRHPEVVMLGGFIQLMGPDCGLLGVERVPVDPEDIRTRLPAHCFFNPTLVFRRDVLEEVGPHRVLFEAGDDVDFALRVAERGPVANLPDALVGYRLRGDSVSDTSLVRQSTAVVAAQESFRRRARGENDPVERAATLDEAVSLLGLDSTTIDEAVSRALGGRASQLARAGLTRQARQLSRTPAARNAGNGPDRRRIAEAVAIATSERLRDDYLGARRSTDPGSGLAMALGLRRAAWRARAAARVLARRVGAGRASSPSKVGV